MWVNNNVIEKILDKDKIFVYSILWIQDPINLLFIVTTVVERGV
jgi:hypothetical protein